MHVLSNLLKAGSVKHGMAIAQKFAVRKGLAHLLIALSVINFKIGDTY